MIQQLHVTVRRQGGPEEESYLQEYVLPLTSDEPVSVMNVLEYIYENLDPTLAYFSHAACRQAACGKCMVKVDGQVRLACKEHARDGMLLEPYSKTVVRDLLCKG